MPETRLKTTNNHLSGILLLVFTDVYFYTDSQIDHQTGTLQRAPRKKESKKPTTFNTSCCAPTLIYSTLIQAPRKLQAFNNKCSAIFFLPVLHYHIGLSLAFALSFLSYINTHTHIYIYLKQPHLVSFLRWVHTSRLRKAHERMCSPGRQYLNHAKTTLASQGACTACATFLPRGAWH